MACVHLVHMKNTSFEVSVLLKYMCVFFFPPFPLTSNALVVNLRI